MTPRNSYHGNTGRLTPKLNTVCLDRKKTLLIQLLSFLDLDNKLLWPITYDTSAWHFRGGKNREASSTVSFAVPRQHLSEASL